MAIYEASVSRSFKASHALRMRNGRLEKSHEHLWCVTAVFRSRRLDEETGVVVDFVEVDSVLGAITEDLDGVDLNDLEAFSDGRPSAERLAGWLAGLLIERFPAGRGLYCLSVTEAPGCSAAFYPDRPGAEFVCG